MGRPKKIALIPSGETRGVPVFDAYFMGRVKELGITVARAMTLARELRCERIEIQLPA